MIARSILVAALVLAPVVPAGAQLYDPNQGCVYQPGTTLCQPLGGPPAAPSPPPGVPPYVQFWDSALSHGVDPREHPMYTEDYVFGRVQVYCGLLAGGEMMKISQEVAYPPMGSLFANNEGRDRLEAEILRIGAINSCPQFWPQANQWLGMFAPGG